MANVKIKGISINIDIESELQEFEWERARWSATKLIAASPFRYDKSPSFYVYLDGEMAGVFGDSGYYDEEWKSGGIVKLLSFLRNETQEETIDYLSEKYNVSMNNEDLRLVIPNIKMPEKRIVLSDAIITQATSPYLTKRGISAEVQEQAGVGYSQHKYFVAIPWHTQDGRLANVKYRATKGKMFFYEKGAVPISSLVYGSHLYMRSEGEDLVVCEAEIDAMSWRTAGYNAVAVGGVSFTKAKSDILKRIPFGRLILAGDNDKAGVRFNAKVIDGMRKCGRPIAIVDRHVAYKDANEALVKYGPGILVSAINSATEISTFSLKII